MIWFVDLESPSNLLQESTAYNLLSHYLHYLKYNIVVSGPLKAIMRTVGARKSRVVYSYSPLNSRRKVVERVPISGSRPKI